MEVTSLVACCRMLNSRANLARYLADVEAGPSASQQSGAGRCPAWYNPIDFRANGVPERFSVAEMAAEGVAL
jgi:hypothetical protein